MIKLVAYLTLVFLCAGNAIAQQKYSAGFIDIANKPESTIDLGIWYPSTEQESRRKWGPFKPEFAWNGEAVSGKFPVIVFSHGHTGRYRNHRDTAASLARAGYVVIAPQHTKDYWVGSDKTVAAVEYRVDEIFKALQIARANKIVGNMLDDDKIGAIGYSLGTLTILKASGVLPSFSRYGTHCKSHNADDQNFCNVIPWWQKVLLWFKNSDLEDKEEFSSTPIPLNLQAIALVAPIGAMFTENEINNVNARISIFRLGEDKQVMYPFHAEYIFKSMKVKKPEYKVYEGVHHYAFISPFPDWLLEEEYIPVAIDPTGFDRMSFLEEINTDLVRFFKENLPVD